jgi:putative SOS response-associated peptidase YedK
MDGVGARRPSLPAGGFAVAGIWRDTAEWSAAYSMVMTEACQHASLVGLDGRAIQTGVHDRMPASLPRELWADWLAGPPDAAGLLCRPWELGMRVERTGEAWVRR